MDPKYRPELTKGLGFWSKIDLFKYGCSYIELVIIYYEIIKKVLKG